MDESHNNSYAIPIAIVIAGAFIGLAIFFTSGDRASTVSNSQPDSTGIVLQPITEDDHILGDPNAPVKIVEFVDLECPFCKQFHTTLANMMNEYGKGGDVAWVYRHFPLDRIHSKARTEAHATECVAELGGNGAFWEYVNRIFQITPSNNGLDLALLADIAEQIGVSRSEFDACQSSGRHADHIQKDLDDAVTSGGDGTPWSIIIDESSGQKYPLNGSGYSTEDLKAIINSIITK